jgi:hypothetical protein
MQDHQDPILKANQIHEKESDKRLMGSTILCHVYKFVCTKKRMAEGGQLLW